MLDTFDDMEGAFKRWLKSSDSQYSEGIAQVHCPLKESTARRGLALQESHAILLEITPHTLSCATIFSEFLRSPAPPLILPLVLALLRAGGGWKPHPHTARRSIRIQQGAWGAPALGPAGRAGFKEVFPPV